MPINDIEMQLSEEEVRKGVIMRTLKRNYAGMDHKNLPVAPNSPLAVKLIKDKVIDMLLFLTLRFQKQFNLRKTKAVGVLDKYINEINKQLNAKINVNKKVDTSQR